MWTTFFFSPFSLFSREEQSAVNVLVFRESERGHLQVWAGLRNLSHPLQPTSQGCSDVEGGKVTTNWSQFEGNQKNHQETRNDYRETENNHKDEMTAQEVLSVCACGPISSLSLLSEVLCWSSADTTTTQMLLILSPSRLDISTYQHSVIFVSNRQ